MILNMGKFCVELVYFISSVLFTLAGLNAGNLSVRTLGTYRLGPHDFFFEIATPAMEAIVDLHCDIMI